jgi:SOS-response transcriptional repressor LexA
MRSDKLTKRQNEVFLSIVDYINCNGYPPSFREIGKRVNLSSSSTVQGFLEQLKKKGYVTWEPHQPRTLRILKTAS